MPTGDLVDRLRFCASALRAAVDGDETADAAAEWFNLGFMATSAAVILEAADELTTLRAEISRVQEDNDRARASHEAWEIEHHRIVAAVEAEVSRLRATIDQMSAVEDL